MFFQPRLDPFAEERPVGQDDSGPAAGFEQPHDQGQEEVGCLLGAEVLRKVRFDPVFFTAAEGGVGQDDVDAVRLGVADVGPGQRVVMTHKAGVFDPMQQHVGDAQHVRELLLFDGPQPFLHCGFLLRFLDVAVTHMADRTGQKAAGAAGGVEEDFAGVRVDPVDHEGGHRPRGVVFPRVPRRLQVVENLFVDVAEVLTLGEVVEIDRGDLVDDLTDQLTRFHVIVGVLEDVLDDAAAVTGFGRRREIFEGGEERPVDEFDELVPRHPLGVGGPGPPLVFLGDRRTVIGRDEFELLVLVVDDLEKKHPTELADPLGIAIDTGVLAHDVLDRLDDGADGHGLGGFLVDRGLQFVNGPFEPCSIAEGIDQLHDAAHRAERGDPQDRGVVEIQHPFVGVLGEEGIEYGAGLAAVLGEDVMLLDRFGTLAPRQRFFVEGDVADQVERVEVFAQFLGDRVERQPFGFELFDDRLFARRPFPVLQEIVEAREAAFQRVFGVIAKALGDQLAMFVEVFDPLGDDLNIDAIDIDLFDRAGRAAGIAGAEVIGAGEERFVGAGGRGERVVIVVGRGDVVGGRDRFAVGRFVDLDRIAVEVGVGEMAGGAAKVDQGKEEFLCVFMDAGATADDLFEFGHRADFAIEHDQATGLRVDAGRKEA